jgi:hypothetical protein
MNQLIEQYLNNNGIKWKNSLHLLASNRPCFDPADNGSFESKHCVRIWLFQEVLPSNT